MFVSVKIPLLQANCGGPAAVRVIPCPAHMVGVAGVIVIAGLFTRTRALALAVQPMLLVTVTV